MTREMILDKVVGVIKDVLLDDSVMIEEETYLIDELELGSLEIMEMVSKLEDEFDVTIPEKEMNHFVQIKDFVNYLETAC